MIQVPRLYHVYKKMGVVESMGQLLKNVFQPVFDALKEPEKHEDLYLLLHQITGWDSVDDESIVSKYTSEGGDLPPPDEYTSPNNPPYSYWAFYMYANIKCLNQFMVLRGHNPLRFRPHCGEAGSLSHLASMFLCADGINHGILLRKCPVLRYLYYMQQIGLALSPLSNNALFMDIGKSPFRSFFLGGMNVSLSTDDPLMFHFTDEPLLEEYSVCAHLWSLSPVDMCEIARMSVLQSGFEPQYKRHWLSDSMGVDLSTTNLSRTNVSNIRLLFRFETLENERKFLTDIISLRSDGVIVSRPGASDFLPRTLRWLGEGTDEGGWLSPASARAGGGAGARRVSGGWSSSQGEEEEERGGAVASEVVQFDLVDLPEANESK
eukprot:GHVN01090462.1.p1 GENE.GHVN01090462.1~~GHVN01090462.1.p1  ORF type:complete len:378 (+),score=47.35 GHVN01090462.1:874-2007(+)